MLRMSTIAGLAAASMLATTTVFLGSTGSIAGAPINEASVADIQPQPVQQAKAQPASPAAQTADEGCTRKVKVVYAGYGEAASGCVVRR